MARQPVTLVTGANGFVGATMVSALVSARHNHKVIMAVRNTSSAEALIAAHPEWPEEAVTVYAVPDFTVEGAFDEVFQEHEEIEYVIHVAAPLLDDPRNTDFVRHFERPSVLGNIGLLTGANRHGRNVRAISVTGSINAITLGDQDDLRARIFGNDSWLPLGREDAIKAQDNYVSLTRTSCVHLLFSLGLIDNVGCVCMCVPDLILRGQEVGGRSLVAVCQTRKAIVHRDQLHAPSDLWAHGANRHVRRQDQL